MKTNKEIFETVLDKISPIDFRVKANLNSEKESLQSKHYLVLTIEEVLSTFKQENLGLCMHNGSIYVYNSEYWGIVQKDELVTFLGNAAHKLGVEKFDASFYMFKQKLLLQFMVSAAFLERQQDKSKVVINLQNGTFEITQEHTTLRGFESEDFLIYQLPFAYNEAATAPLFMKYLDRVLPSKELQDILSEFIGYIFIKNLKLEKCLLLLGSGANGKSVFFEIINSLLGKENISNLNMGNLNDPNGRAVIVNKLLNYGSELNAHDIRTETLKQLISGEPIECKILFKDKFQCDDYARLMFNCNELPKQVEHNEAFFRRFLIIPFNVTIPENERDPQLADSIINTELSGVFNWVLEGLKRLLINNRFTSSEESKEVLNNYRKESDNVSLYLEESCVTKSTSSGILLNDLYYEYSQFCKECGHRACSNITFSKRLKALGFEFHRKQEGNIVYATRQGFSSSKIIIREEPTFPAFSTSKNQPPFPVYTGENNDDEIWS